MKKIVIAVMVFLFASFFFGCKKTVTFSMQGVEKITVFSGESGRRLEIEDEEAIRKIATNFNGLAFEREKASGGYDGFLYSMKWYDGEGRLTEELSLLDERRIKYNGYFYQTQGEIDVGYIGELFDPYYQKPKDSELAFWITQDLANEDLSSYSWEPAFMGAKEYYPKEYEQGAREYVSYLVGAYPDYADGGSFVTRISVTDPKIKVLNGLTVASELEAWDVALQGLRFHRQEVTEDLDEGVEYKELWISDDGEIHFTLMKGEKGYGLTISVAVTNREGLGVN